MSTSRLLPAGALLRATLFTTMPLCALGQAGCRTPPEPVSRVQVTRTYGLSLIRSWNLRADCSGAAEVSVESRLKPEHRRFTVQPEQWTALENIIESERFFRLADEYGEIVPDSGTTVLRISTGTREKAVTLHFLGNWAHSDPMRLRDPARALRVLRLVLAWSADDYAASANRSVAQLLAAAEASK